MSTLGRGVAWLDDHAPGVAVFTTAVTFLLLLLGLYTAAIGAGATCNNTYPGCAGQLSPLGLTLPQFVEWFHRLVAMSVGFVIFGNALVLHHRFGRTKAAYAGWLALLVLPLQVVLGGTTVTFAGMVPGGYEPSVQSLHFYAALAIFTALVAATAWAYRQAGRLSVNAVGTALRVAAGAFAVHLLFARDLLFTFTAEVQILYRFAGLLGFAALVAALCWSPPERVRRTAGAAVALYLVQTVLSVGALLITRPVELASYAVGVAILLVALAATRAFERDANTSATPGTAD